MIDIRLTSHFCDFRDPRFSIFLTSHTRCEMCFYSSLPDVHDDFVPNPACRYGDDEAKAKDDKRQLFWLKVPLCLCSRKNLLNIVFPYFHRVKCTSFGKKFRTNYLLSSQVSKRSCQIVLLCMNNLLDVLAWRWCQIPSKVVLGCMLM